MLPVPPCIPGLVGCDASSGVYDGGYTGDGSSGSTGGSGGFGGGSTGGGGSTLGTSTGGSGTATSSSSRSSMFGFGSGSGNSSSSRSSIFGTSGSSSSRSRTSIFSGMGSNASSAGRAVTTQAKRIAQYTLTAVNRGKQALKNVIIEHGPLPSGAIFDSSRSTKGCTQVGSSVQCTTDLEPGQSKDFSLAYEVKNSMSCALAKALQKAKTTVNGITGSSTSGLSTSITCSMKTEASNGVAASAGAGGGLANGGFGGPGGSLGSGSGSVAPGMIVGADGSLSGKGGTKPGYKPYAGVRMPRTGAADAYVTSTRDYILTPVQKAASGHMFQFSGILLSTIVGAAILALILKKRLFA